MFLRRFRLPSLLFAALWLPFQAVAAQAMTFCQHGRAQQTPAMQATMAEDADMAADCPMHHGAQQPGPSSGATDHGLGCDQCGFCHLASAGFMGALFERATPVVRADRVFAVAVLHAPPSNIPEPPQRPPRQAA